MDAFSVSFSTVTAYPYSFFYLFPMFAFCLHADVRCDDISAMVAMMKLSSLVTIVKLLNCF